MNPSHSSCILITGATGGIGGALAESYAGPGISLVLHGQNRQRLDELAATCRSRGARVLVEAFDITDVEKLTGWVNALEGLAPPDLVIVSQGRNTHIGPNGEGEGWDAVDALIDVNVRATMALVHAVLPGMRRRGGGQIALLSSLAAFHGLPLTPSYSASKAAVKAYGEALRGWLAPEGIRVNVVMPGYVESRMCREMPGPKPFLWSPEKTALVIRRGLEQNRARISFPFPLNFGTWWLAVLPAALSERILRYLGYRG